MLNEFPDTHDEFPAKVFNSVCEAQEFTALLTRLEISHRVSLQTFPKRLNLPMQTVVMLLDLEYGVRH